MHLSYKMRRVCIDTSWASPLPPSGQHWFYLVSPSLLPPPPGRQRLSRSWEYWDTPRVSVVSQDAGPCRLGGGGLGLQRGEGWRNRGYSLTWALSFTQSLSRMLSGCLLLCWDYFLQVGKQNKTKSHSLLWYDWKMEKLEGILTIFLWKAVITS